MTDTVLQPDQSGTESETVDFILFQPLVVSALSYSVPWLLSPISPISPISP
eukprot:CAMPEP_0184290844 /NCGR_PEP_ID=MMETSP1049-20130417/2994_1 /TAXON_ID=77928 /ORGANISM="Proteomonas sulcata, Strain CCMP704" /LENGTH=50 /DNA_ID=CAMNT_0026598105 /DNA_START=412 /DNA_END=561 /DNA_ORIENTATION=+